MNEIDLKNIKPDDLIKRFASIQDISEEKAKELVGAETSEEILNNITSFTKNRIYEATQPMNRKQRRALSKKLGKKGRSRAEMITDTAEKLNYIDLIQKLRLLNAQKDKEIEENGETTTEND